MSLLSALVVLLAGTSSLTSASPLFLESRASTNINPNAVRNTVCTSPNTAIDFHDMNVAQLSICGGIAGAITQCQGRPASTVGASGTAKFSLDPLNDGALLIVSKGRWEGCVRAARAVCGDHPYTSVCVGGTTNGDFAFTLTRNTGTTQAAPAVSPAASPAASPAPAAAAAKPNVNPAAVTGTTCTSPSTKIDFHDINVALLSICGSIAGTIQQCKGNPSSTVGSSGTAKLTLTPVNAGATLTVTKGRWESCMRAARATCGDSPFVSTCIGGTTNGNFKFVLTKN